MSQDVPYTPFGSRRITLEITEDEAEALLAGLQYEQHEAQLAYNEMRTVQTHNYLTLLDQLYDKIKEAK